MRWTVIQCTEFQEEFEQFPEGLQDDLLAYEEVLAQRGPGLGRPLVDTLSGTAVRTTSERTRERGKEKTMSRTHDVILNSLSEGRRQKIQARAAEIMDELTLRELRQALGLSQKELAELMCVSQPAVSKQERRTDMQLSTLAGVIHAMGGTLEITAHFPDKGTVRLTRGM